MKVYVAVFSHRHGTDLTAYATAELANEAAFEIADEWWEREMPTWQKRPDSRKELADQYWERMTDHGESFEVQELEIEGMVPITATVLDGASTKAIGDTVFIALPADLRVPVKGGCVCDYCKSHPKTPSEWDTLAVGASSTNGFSWKVHYPALWSTP